MIQRGASPLYADADTDTFILNQQCNRWNEIDLSFMKSVDMQWLSSINKEKFTKINDVIINSTGEGTIGRSTLITKSSKGLMYDSHMLLVRLKDIIPAYFVEIFNSHLGQNQIETIKSAQSTKQTELGIQNLKKIEIPLPPLEKQQEIVEHITKLRAQISELQTNSHNIISNTKETIKNQIIK